MVSFFFTPIYMFILIFIVSFGTKKGTLAAYSGSWYSLLSSTFALLFNTRLKVDTKQWNVRRFYLYRFQHTALTSRTTIYILFTFWCFFFFFGEILLLTTLNYNTLIDQIPSSFFVLVKSHVVFMTDSSNAFLGDMIFFFVLFFSTTAAAFLLNLRYTHAYSYNKVTALLDIGSLLFILYIFAPVWAYTLILGFSVIRLAR